MMGAEYDHVYEAAEKGKEGELSFWIQRGGSVNRRNWGVRRRMCLAWAPASPPPLLLRSPSPPRQRPPCAVSPQPRRRWPFAAAPPSLSHPLVLAHSPRVLWHLMMTPVCLMCPARRIHSSHSGLMRRARRVRPTPHRVRGDRGRRHGCLRKVSSALRGSRRPLRDRQASPRTRRGSDAPRQGRRHCPRLGKSALGQSRDIPGEWQERGRGSAE